MNNGSDSPDTAPTLMHHLGTNEIVRSYTSYELGPDLAPALKNQRMLREVSKEDESLKIPMTSDEDTVSLLLSPSVAAQSDMPPKQLQQRPRKKSKLAGSGNGSISSTVVKIFLMTQDSIDLERPVKAKFAIMWDAMKKMHEPSVIEGSEEANNQLVEIIRKKLRAKQLPHASDRPFGNLRGSHNGIGMGNLWVPSTNKHVVKTAKEMQTDYPVRRDETFQHGYIPYRIDESRLAWSCTIDSRISLADDPTPLVVDLFPAHKRIGYDKKTAVKIMDDDNRDIAIFIITHMLTTCRAIIIQGDDGKNILPSVFRNMGLVGVILSDKMIKHLVPDYSCHRAEYSIEADFPAYLTFNKKTGKTCFILTCPQIGSSLVRPDINKYEFKFWTRVIHLLVSVFLKITGAKYRQECFPDFTTVEESVLSILNTKKGASDHMKLIVKSGQLSNVVIFKAPRQIGGENSHATDPGKIAGSHFIETKNRDSMPTVDRGKASHATDPGKAAGSHFIEKMNRDSMSTVDRCRKAAKASNATDPGKAAGSHFIEKKNRDSIPTVDRGRMGGKASLGKPKSGSTDFFVTEEVNPVNKTPLSEKGSRFANTKKKL